MQARYFSFLFRDRYTSLHDLLFHRVPTIVETKSTKNQFVSTCSVDDNPLANLTFFFNPKRTIYRTTWAIEQSKEPPTSPIRPFTSSHPTQTPTPDSPSKDSQAAETSSSSPLCLPSQPLLAPRPKPTSDSTAPTPTLRICAVPSAYHVTNISNFFSKNPGKAQHWKVMITVVSM